MLKPHQIEELAQNLASEIDCSCEHKENLIGRFKATIENYLQNNEVGVYELKPDDTIYTHGGEAIIDDLVFDDYGICLGEISIYNIKPNQMIHLAQVIVDHLLINRHEFEIQKTGKQDQTERLVCLDVEQQND